MKTPAGQDANATRTPPDEAAGEDPFGFSPWLKQMPDVPLHPLMAHPVAGLVATTAIGFGLAGQMAGMMLGMMQSAAERTKAVLDEAAERAVTPEPAERKAPPVLRIVPKAQAPAARKTEKAARTGATPKTAAKAARADDLKAISGIGPKLEQVLNGMGFRRYADIAALTDGDVARIEAELGFSGRIARDGWVEQTRTLAKGRG